MGNIGKRLYRNLATLAACHLVRLYPMFAFCFVRTVYQAVYSTVQYYVASLRNFATSLNVFSKDPTSSGSGLWLSRSTLDLDRSEAKPWAEHKTNKLAAISLVAKTAIDCYDSLALACVEDGLKTHVVTSPPNPGQLHEV